MEGETVSGAMNETNGGHDETREIGECYLRNRDAGFLPNPTSQGFLRNPSINGTARMSRIMLPMQAEVHHSGPLWNPAV
jgi:hypothetical protein